MRMHFQSIIADTDIIPLSEYMNNWVDDQGNEYKLNKLIMCRPHPPHRA